MKSRIFAALLALVSSAAFAIANGSDPFQPASPTHVIAVTNVASAGEQIDSLSTGCIQYQLTNTGTTDVWVGFGVSATAANAATVIPVAGTPQNSILVRAGAATVLTKFSAAYVAAITASGTSTLTATCGTGLLTGAPGTNVTTTPLSGSQQDVNVKQFGGNAVVTGTGTSGVGVPRVTVSSDSAVTQGTAAPASGAWPAKVTDGTNVAAVKAASTGAAATDPALVTRPMMPTDGTNTQPAMDASTRAGFVKVTDGTNTATVTVGGALNVAPQPASPPSANILIGRQSFTATTAATMLVTITAGKTFTGTLGSSTSCQTVAGTATACNAVAAFATGGGGTMTPASGTALFDCAATSGANAATGTVGSQSANYCYMPVTVACTSGTCTITLASTNAGTASTVSGTASGTQQ